MLHRKQMWAITLLVMLAAGLLAPLGQPVRPAAAGGMWSAWLYNPDTGMLVHAFPDGVAPEVRTLPLPPGISTYPYEVAISPSGTLLAACMFDPAGITSVQVYDLLNDRYQAAYTLAGTTQGCLLGEYAFSPDSSRLAFGLMNHYPDPADLRPDWELNVIDVQTGTVLYRIDAKSPVLTSSLGTNYPGHAPMITAHEPTVIAFAPVMWGTEGAPEYDSVVWQLGDNSVSILGPYGKVGLDLLHANGEAIWLEERDDFPKGVLEGPGYLFNVVMYSNKSGSQFPIFSNGPSVLGSPVFIDEGRRVAVQTYTAPGLTRWMWFGRDGSGGALPADIGAYRLFGTLDGYVFLNPDSGFGGAPELRYHRFMGGDIPQSFIAWSGGVGENWQLAWVNPLAGGAGLSPFPAAPPGDGSLALTPGGRAAVHTTEGDQLRVRSGPGTTYQVAFQLRDGTPVTVLEGPVAGNGYNWWRIQTSDGRTGWAIEGLVDGGVWLQTLVPVP